MTYKIIPDLTPKQQKSFEGAFTITDECIEWKGITLKASKTTRGVVTIRKKNFLASRIAYKLYHKRDPAEMMVCHTCDNPLCINQKHLFLGTQADNMKDKALKMRGATKLTPEQVTAIREDREKGLSYGQLRIKYGVQKSCLFKIVNREMWKFVKGERPSNDFSENSERPSNDFSEKGLTTSTLI